MKLINSDSQKIGIASTIIPKTEELSEMKKLILERDRLKVGASDLYGKLGQKVYQYYLSGEERMDITEELAALDAINQQIEETMKKVNILNGLIICPKCGAGIPAESKECPYCGYRVHK